MLAYFHFACAGSYPLSSSSNAGGYNSGIYGNMEPEQIEYIKSINQEIAYQGQFEMYHSSIRSRHKLSKTNNSHELMFRCDRTKNREMERPVHVRR